MDASEESSRKPRDDQQRRVVERLRAAEGEPVDFEELLAIGVEHPAVVCYELELSGVPIVQHRQASRLLFSLPLQPTAPVGDEEQKRRHPRPRRPPAPAPVGDEEQKRRHPRPRRPPAPAPEAIVERRGIPRGPPRARRWLVREVAVPGQAGVSPRAARLALLAAAVALAVAGVALIARTPSDHSGGTAGAGTGSTRAHTQTRTSSTSERAPAPVAPESEGNGLPAVPDRLQARTPSVPISPTAAAALESEGHQLLAAGRYSVAIDRLLGAIRASGQSLARCREPTTEACLTLAYALYDLGRALRLGGDPGAAVPVLRQRLRIDNQRPIVRQELDLARGAGA